MILEFFRRLFRGRTDPFDLDGDGKPGGSLTRREIHADLEAMGVEFDPREHHAHLLAQRNRERKRRNRPF